MLPNFAKSSMISVRAFREYAISISQFYLRLNDGRYLPSPKIIGLLNLPPSVGAISASPLAISVRPWPSTSDQRPSRYSMPAIWPRRGTSSPGRTAKMRLPSRSQA